MDPAPIYTACPACRGKGRVLTRDGEAITGLLRAAGFERLIPEG